tara:strand:+ start:239 stop:445 length:207 start_codon:yes stop_codon:yes gene_type:complete
MPILSTQLVPTLACALPICALHARACSSGSIVAIVEAVQIVAVSKEWSSARRDRTLALKIPIDSLPGG